MEHDSRNTGGASVEDYDFSQLTADERKEMLRQKIRQFEAQMEDARLMAIANEAVDKSAGAQFRQSHANSRKAAQALREELERLEAEH